MIALFLFLLFSLMASVEVQALAFPSAQGFGQLATGGRGGVPCFVTNTNSSGAGSFRACMETTGSRTVLFRVGGTIDFHTDAIGDGGTPVGNDLTVACQTAPGDGVLLKGEIKLFLTENVIMRHCRIRPGDQPDSSSETTNALLTHGPGPPHNTAPYYSIFDHMSMGSSNDDIGGHYNQGTVDSYVTFQNSIFSESVGGVLGGEVSRGMIIAGTANNKVSFINNLFANYTKRSPSVQGSTMQFVNNVMHWINCCEGTYLQPLYGPVVAHIENNFFGARSCCSTETQINVVGCGYSGWTSNCNTAWDNASNIYVHGNTHTLLRPSAATGSETAMVRYFAGVNIMNTKVQSTTPIAGMPALPALVDSVAARTRIINNAGVRSHPLDSFDQRVINDVINDTGRRCDGVNESTCLTFGSYATGTAPTDTDNDGMPDTWETAHGLNPASATDGPALHANGYSNLENYINHLAGDEFDEGTPVEPSTGDVKVCIDSHTFPITQPTTATCDVSFGTPKGALAFASRMVTSGTDAAGVGFSAGAYDGTRQWAVNVAAMDNVATADTDRIQATDEMLQFVQNTAVIDGEYNASAFVADGITWASGDTLTAPAVGKVVLFGGSDLSVYASSAQINLATGASTVLSGVPFKADMLLFAGVNSGSLDTSGGNYYVCLGAAIQVSDVITQAFVTQHNLSGAASTDMAAVVEDRYACGTTTSTANQLSIEVSAITTTGFTVTGRYAAGNVYFHFLALNFNGTKTPFLQVINSPTAPGIVSYTTPATLVPEFAMMLSSLVGVTQTRITTADANAFSVGMFTASQAAAIGVVAEDANPSVTDNASFVSADAVRVDSLVGTTSHRASVSAMTAGTLALNYSAASGSAKKWILVGWSGTPFVPTAWTTRRQFSW